MSTNMAVSFNQCFDANHELMTTIHTMAYPGCRDLNTKVSWIADKIITDARFLRETLDNIDAYEQIKLSLERLNGACTTPECEDIQSSINTTLTDVRSTLAKLRNTGYKFAEILYQTRDNNITFQRVLGNGRITDERILTLANRIMDEARAFVTVKEYSPLHKLEVLDRSLLCMKASNCRASAAATTLTEYYWELQGMLGISHCIGYKLMTCDDFQAGINAALGCTGNIDVQKVYALLHGIMPSVDSFVGTKQISEKHKIEYIDYSVSALEKLKAFIPTEPQIHRFDLNIKLLRDKRAQLSLPA